ncbi:hypothetical protein OH491_24380 [Termitidicoccus mucosus]|uniref:hypothetical protein n=1 Tax=Termitidicoccus mucosus TaxID=1184151 RepID=UPI0011AB86E9
MNFQAPGKKILPDGGFYRGNPPARKRRARGAKLQVREPFEYGFQSSRNHLMGFFQKLKIPFKNLRKKSAAKKIKSRATTCLAGGTFPPHF